MAVPLLLLVTAYALAAAFRKSSAASWLFPQGVRRNARIVVGICTALVAVLSVVIVAPSRDQYVRVKKEMTWECAPDKYMPENPEAQPVRFRYVEDPHYEEVASGRGLCDQLKSSGKRVVVVEFEAWGNSSSGLRGFHEISVDGKPLVDVGGWGSSGSTDAVGPHPLRKLFK
ncbi:MAG: hypothetical protein LAO21_01025 [Acidobacteriia bacterium]|nr:hypothetical protein [Terriglobia bacterium]